MPQTILLFGAGKSATYLIEYLDILARDGTCQVIIADADELSIKRKLKPNSNISTASINVSEEIERNKLIVQADVVISLMPPDLHYLIATSCLLYKKHLLTASYLDDKVKLLAPEITKADILFLYELGLDPGIDHISAMGIIHSLKQKKAIIHSFISHCGGLISPKYLNNPWKYKITWNPKNVVLAGKAGAIFKENNQIKTLDYHEIFNAIEQVQVNSLGILECYPNRDSLSYISTYDIPNVETFKRTTLRYPNFCKGWKSIISLKLTQDDIFYDTNQLSFNGFLLKHLRDQHLKDDYDLLENSVREQINFLFEDANVYINKGRLSVAEILQIVLEKKLKLSQGDKDLVIMQHEIVYSIENKKYQLTSTLVLEGEDETHTAMAKTVGLPLGIAAKLILNGTIHSTGLKIPIDENIYKPILNELKNYGIQFKETIKDL